MKKLKTNIVMILLTVFSIIGAIGPISTANAAGEYYVTKKPMVVTLMPSI